MSDVIHCKSVIEYLADTQQNDLCKLILKKWHVVKELVFVLQIPYKATVALQYRSLTLSDTYGIWLKTKIFLEEIIKKHSLKTNLAKCLIAALNKRKHTVVNNDAMLCALYLDPRYRNEIMCDEQKTERAIGMLSNLWNRIDLIRNIDTVETTQDISVGSSNLSLDFDSSETLNSYLSQTGNETSPSSQQNTSRNEVNIQHELTRFQPQTLSSNDSILEFWELNKSKQKHLYELAKVIFAIPPTEVDIERDYSKLKFIFTERRQSLSEQLLQDILTIHLNPELFFIIKNEELSSY